MSWSLECKAIRPIADMDIGNSKLDVRYGLKKTELVDNDSLDALCVSPWLVDKWQFWAGKPS